MIIADEDEFQEILQELIKFKKDIAIKEDCISTAALTLAWKKGLTLNEVQISKCIHSLLLN